MTVVMMEEVNERDCDTSYKRGRENAGQENDGQNRRSGKRRDKELTRKNIVTCKITKYTISLMLCHCSIVQCHARYPACK